MGFSVEPTTETERAVQLPAQYQLISFWQEECQLRCHADSEVSTAERGQLKEWDIMVHKIQKLNSLLSHLL